MIFGRGLVDSPPATRGSDAATLCSSSEGSDCRGASKSRSEGESLGVLGSDQGRWSCVEDVRVWDFEGILVAD